MGKPSRDKGARFEREIVNLHKEWDLPCERVPLSGAAGGSFGGDIKALEVFKGEAKCRADGVGFALLYRWIEGSDILYLKRDRSPRLYVLSEDTYLKWAQAYHECSR